VVFSIVKNNAINFKKYFKYKNINIKAKSDKLKHNLVNCD